MAVRYTPYQQRKATFKRREADLRAAVRASEGFTQVPVMVEPSEAPVWPPTPFPGRVVVFDLHAWTHPRVSTAAIGPFYIVCGICDHRAEITGWVDADRAQRTHYQKHYLEGETP